MDNNDDINVVPPVHIVREQYAVALEQLELVRKLYRLSLSQDKIQQQRKARRAGLLPGSEAKP